MITCDAHAFESHAVIVACPGVTAWGDMSFEKLPSEAAVAENCLVKAPSANVIVITFPAPKLRP